MVGRYISRWQTPNHTLPCYISLEKSIRIQKYKNTKQQIGKDVQQTQNTNMYKNLSMQTSKQKKKLKGKLCHILLGRTKKYLFSKLNIKEFCVLSY